jgi:hypothetical protein
MAIGGFCQNFYEKPLWNIRKNNGNPPLGDYVATGEIVIISF